MKLISHRGNIDGPNPEKENSPDYIRQALSLDYDVEIDLRLIDGKLMLGHDVPQHEVDQDFLKTNGLWVHCKNVEALEYCLDYDIHCFFHVTDNATLTSQGFIWTYPGKTLTPGSICVMPEWETEGIVPECGGICSDFIARYKVVEI